MKILQTIALDFGRDTVPITVFAKQNDTKSRFVEITPLDRGQSYKLESGITARLHLTKADGHTVINDATISGGIITAELTQQALAAEGVAVAEIGLYSGDELLSSQMFYVNVEKTAYKSGVPESSDEYGSFVDALSKVQGALDAAAEATEDAKNAADSVDKTIQNANKAISSANTAAAAALEAAAAVGDKIDGIVIIDNDNNSKYLGKFRISSGYPALEITQI